MQRAGHHYSSYSLHPVSVLDVIQKILYIYVNASSAQQSLQLTHFSSSNSLACTRDRLGEMMYMKLGKRPRIS